VPAAGRRGPPGRCEADARPRQKRESALKGRAIADKLVTVTLSEEAFQLARSSRDIALAPSTLAKILGTKIDISLGSEQLCRHPVLTVAEAKGLYEYYKRSADAFARTGDGAKALICAKARAAIRYELWRAGISK